MLNRRPVCVFVALVVLAFVLACASFVCVVKASGRGYCTERWVPAYFAFKMERLRRAQSPRFVILSGSNAQNTIDCDELADAVKMDVVCAGLIYTIPLRFYRPMVEDVLQPGDVLYLPLEVWHYRMTRDSLTSPFAVSFLWGVYPEALGALSLSERLDLYARKGIPWLQCVLPKCAAGEFSVADPLQQYNWVERYAGTSSVGFFRLRGDNVNNPATTMDPLSSMDAPVSLSEEFERSFAEIREMAARRGVRVLLGNVACYSYPREKNLSSFQELLRGLGVPVCGDPAALCLPYCCFTDSNMHCNAAGRRLFTHEIARDVCGKLGKSFEERDGWPLVTFKPESGRVLRFQQPDDCAGVSAFGEFILDRMDASATNVVAQVLVNGRPVRFEERAYAAKNTLWVWWNRAERDLSVEIVPKAGLACRAERVLMEPDPSDAISTITGINDISPDFTETEEGQFVCRSGNAQEAYLRVRVPNWKSNRHRLHLTLRGDDVLRQAKVGGTASYRRGLLPSEVEDGKISVSIPLNASGAFVADDGYGYAGIYFPPGTLSGGERIEVVRGHFEML